MAEYAIFKPALETIKRLKANINPSANPIELKKLPNNDENIIDALLRAAPYYIFKYGDKGLEYLKNVTGTAFPMNVFYAGLRYGFKYINKRLRIK